MKCNGITLLFYQLIYYFSLLYLTNRIEQHSVTGFWLWNLCIESILLIQALKSIPIGQLFNSIQFNIDCELLNWNFFILYPPRHPTVHIRKIWNKILRTKTEDKYKRSHVRNKQSLFWFAINFIFSTFNFKVSYHFYLNCSFLVMPQDK